MVVGAVAATPCKALRVPAQRFSMSMDPLTLRLLNKLRKQGLLTCTGGALGVGAVHRVPRQLWVVTHSPASPTPLRKCGSLNGGIVLC
jgi:hypothetical protein